MKIEEDCHPEPHSFPSAGKKVSVGGRMGVEKKSGPYWP